MRPRLIAAAAAALLFLAGCGSSESSGAETKNIWDDPLGSESSSTEIKNNAKQREDSLPDSTGEDPSEAVPENSTPETGLPENGEKTVYDLTGTWEITDIRHENEGPQTAYINEAHVWFTVGENPDTGEQMIHKRAIGLDRENRYLVTGDSKYTVTGIDDERIVSERYTLKRISKDTGGYSASEEDKALAAKLIGTWEHKWGDEPYEKRTYTFHENGIVEEKGCHKYSDEWFTDIMAYYVFEGNFDTFGYEIASMDDKEIVFNGIDNFGNTLKLTKIVPDENTYAVNDNVSEVRLDDGYIKDKLIGKWQFSGKYDAYLEFTEDMKVYWYFKSDAYPELGYSTSYWNGQTFEIRDGRIYILDSKNASDNSYIRIENLTDSEFEFVCYINAGNSGGGSKEHCTRRTDDQQL